METVSTIETIAGVIQLAVAPVFLLAGIAGFLNVLSIRLGRIVDRTRIIDQELRTEADQRRHKLLESETNGLWRRIRMIYWSIRVCVTAALTVCLVIMALFIGEFINADLALLIAFLFVLAMLLLIVGLILFLLEISVSTQRTRAELSDSLEENR